MVKPKVLLRRSLLGGGMGGIKEWVEGLRGGEGVGKGGVKGLSSRAEVRK